MAKAPKKPHPIKGKNSLTSEMLNDLQSLKHLLAKYMSADVVDVGLLESAITAINTVRKLEEKHNEDSKTYEKPEEWNYEISRFMFRNLNLDRKKPSEDAILEMTLTIGGSCEEPNPIHDLLHGFSLQFLLKGVDEEKSELKCAFRFERHIYNDGDGTPEFWHPLYHFQYGSDELLEDEYFDPGHVLFIKAPRLMHPPMDIVLAIDFVLGNFYSKEKEEIINLHNDTDYTDVVNRAKKRFWRPYYLGLSSNFTTNFTFVSESNIRINKTFSKNIILYKKEH